MVPTHLSVSDLCRRPNDCDPENKIGSVRDQVRQKESSCTGDGMGPNQPQSQPSHETQHRQCTKQKRIHGQ